MAADPKLLSKLLLHNARSKVASLLLLIIGVLFGSLWLSEIVPAILSDKIPEVLVETGLWVNPIHVLDLSFLLPCMIITSVLLWNDEFYGSLLAVPLLVFSVAMGFGIIAMFIVSASRGIAIPMPAAIVVCLIMLLSACCSCLFLKEIK
jgi:hypothetical protein